VRLQGQSQFLLVRQILLLLLPIAALWTVNEPAAVKNDFEVVYCRIQERKESVSGKDWADKWQVGLPNYYQSEKGSQ
jgi:hypothetical protein